MNLLKKFKKDLRNLADPQKAVVLQKFFKTGKGQYGEGDKFLGITVPKQRYLIKNYMELTLDDIANLLASPWHEERLCAVLLLVAKYQKTQNIFIKNRFSGHDTNIPKQNEQQNLYNFYLDNTTTINNWDLVDLSAPHIVGHYLYPQDKDKTILYSLAQNENLWSRRISIIATLYFIRNNHHQETLALTQKLLGDKEDLIHKACGWMLREVGKRDVKILKDFLQSNLKKMPRTMLRYAIERFPEQERKFYLHLE